MEAMATYSHESGKNSCEDLRKISRNIGPMIDGTVMEIFRLYKMQLLSESVDYIVQAVWGIKKGGGLDSIQKEIYTRLNPAANKIIDLFQFEDINDAQEFAIEFLVKSLIINKISYMIDGVKNRLANELGRYKKNLNILNNVKMLGSA
ncbi:MAG: hypothetical protein SWH54_09810 [Thermodesulfobacteriota bacterium]|nr:hypothetical protein [Thermodesulfobacteriota bacterium]